jgi:hypothetical protein
MRRWISVLFILGLLPGLAFAQMIQSGDFIMDLQDYVPGDNGEFIISPGNILVNPGFETGDLPPWTTNNWTVISTDSNTGTYCADDEGNFWLRQDFAPVDVSLVNAVTMYSKQPEGIAFQAVDFYYSATDYDEFLVAPGVDWTFINMTSELRAVGELQAIRIWGYTGGGGDPDITRVDDVVVDIEAPNATEESTWGRIKAIYQ